MILGTVVGTVSINPTSLDSFWLSQFSLCSCLHRPRRYSAAAMCGTPASGRITKAWNREALSTRQEKSNDRDCAGDGATILT